MVTPHPAAGIKLLHPPPKKVQHAEKAEKYLDPWLVLNALDDIYFERFTSITATTGVTSKHLKGQLGPRVSHGNVFCTNQRIL